MSGAHEPRREFVDHLELLLRADLRRQSLAKGTWSWLPRSRIAAALAVAAVVIVSMAVGGGVVATAYEAKRVEQRSLLLETFEQRAVIAKQRLALLTQQLRDAQERVAVGLEPDEGVASDIRAKVAEAEAEVKSIDLDIAEIRTTGREPMHALSAPLVSGRDFVTERWRAEMAAPAAALANAKMRAKAARARFEVGLANSMDIEAAETRVIELNAAVEGFERKIGIRQTFLKGGVSAAVAELRALEADAELRRTAFVRRIEFARKQVEEVKSRINVGTANPLTLVEAELRVQELELEMSKVGYELLLIRRQLGK
jgi:outer membrane protein TolC